jgi:hypothetical protein
LTCLNLGEVVPVIASSTEHASYPVVRHLPQHRSRPFGNHRHTLPDGATTRRDRITSSRLTSWSRNGVNDQHVREAQGEGRVGYGRAQTADQVRGPLACSVHNGTARPLLLTGRCVSHGSDMGEQWKIRVFMRFAGQQQHT